MSPARNLLVVTDHRFFADPDGAVYDTYCFDRGFFADYRAVFDTVRVAARVRHEPIPERASRSDGDGVSFVHLDDIQGAAWVLSPPARYMGQLKDAVTWADAVCVRIPSIAGSHAFRWAHGQKKPVMFELIGDPMSAVTGPGHGLPARAFGIFLAGATRLVTTRSTVGSYVSRAHLQKRYPARKGVLTESISSIRLPASEIRPPRRFASVPDVFQLALTASLVPVKDHETLVRAVAHARTELSSPQDGPAADAPALRLHLMGDGPCRSALESLARELGISDHVVFHGHVVERARMDQILDASHLFVMTSVSEGMPRAMIEAMARGLPCVGTRAGGIAELLGSSDLVEVGDHRALGQLIASVARDPERLERMAGHSRATAEEFVDTVLSERRQRLLGALRDACAGRA